MKASDNGAEGAALWEQANREYVAVRSLLAESSPPNEDMIRAHLAVGWELIGRLGFGEWPLPEAEPPEKVDLLTAKKRPAPFCEIGISAESLTEQISLLAGAGLDDLRSSYDLLGPTLEHCAENFVKPRKSGPLRRTAMFLAAAVIVALALFSLSSFFFPTMHPETWRAHTYGSFYIQKKTPGKLGFDRTTEGEYLAVGGFQFNNGIATHAPSRLRLRFIKKAPLLLGWCGIDGGCREKGSAVCVVRSGEKELFRSRIIRGGERAVGFVVPVVGLDEVELIAEDAGDGNECDNVDWLHLRMEDPSAHRP